MTEDVCGARIGRTGVCDMPPGHPPIAESMGWLHGQTLRAAPLELPPADMSADPTRPAVRLPTLAEVRARYVYPLDRRSPR